MLIPVLFCLSCSGGKFNPVHGKVLYKNEPLKGVLVTFHPQSEKKLPDLPVGVTGEDGSFSLKTGKGEGAPAGDYVVTLYSPIEQKDSSGKAVKPKGMAMQREMEDRFKGAYGDPLKPKIKVSITNGTNNLDPFDLK
jgi:hypothetical protein